MKNKKKDMELMQYLNYINIYFFNLSKFQKFEVYVIITILIFSLYSFNKKEIIIYEKVLEHANNMSNLEVLSSIENWSKKNKILIEKVDLSSSILVFTLSSRLNNVINFLYYVENITTFTEITNLILFYNKKSKKFQLELSVSFNNIKNNNINLKKLEVINVFKALKNRKELRLSAIYGKYIILNHKVLTLNDKYKSYKIIDIKKDRVLLYKDNKEKVLRIEKDVRNK